MSTKRPAKTGVPAEAESPPKLSATRARTGPFLAQGLLLVAVTAAAYLPAVRCGYIWDDDDYVSQNAMLRSADGLRQIWFKIGATTQYYPLVYTTYWLEYQLWGSDPSGYHVVNIVLHALGALLLWRGLTVLRVPGAWLAGAAFALHPVHVESVVWITERKNVLSGVFYLSAALAYFRFALGEGNGSGHTRPKSSYAAALVLFVCSLLSKTVACTLPAVLLLVLWWKRKRITGWDVGALAPFFALGIAFGLLTASVEESYVGAVGEEWNQTFVEQCLVAGHALAFYAGKIFWPAQLTFIYPRWQIDADAWQQYLYPIGAVSVMWAFWLARRRTGRGPLVAILYFAGTLFPALGFFHVYFMQFSYVADHFQYLASVGLITLGAAAVYMAADRRGTGARHIKTVLTVCVVATLGTLTWRQAGVYLNLETLWRDTVRKNPDAWLAHNNLGMILKGQGKVEEAITHYRHALQLNPEYPDAHNNLGNALYAGGKLGEARDHLRKALAMRPMLAEVWLNLGNILAQQSELGEAIEHYRHAIRLKPQLPEAHSNLGKVLTRTGPAGEALQCLKEAARLRPGWPVPLKTMAWTLATHPDAGVRDGPQAVRLAEKALALTGTQDPAILDILAAAYAETGRFDRAVSTAQTALTLASGRYPVLAAQVQARLDLYRRGQTFRQPVRPGE